MAALLDFLMPRACPGCHQEGVDLCDPCARPLRRRLGEPPGVPLGLPAWLPGGIVQLEWLASFTGTTRAILHALKYDGGRHLAEPVGELLARRWSRARMGGELFVPVPLHRDRLHQRGYDQALLLARVVGRHLQQPVVGALQRDAATDAQYVLGRDQRRANVGHAFHVAPRCAPAVAGRWIVLVDDILTTGATLAACAAALRRAGARAVSALVVARER